MTALARRRPSTYAHPTYRTASLCLPNGKTLEAGDEFTVKGEGRYVFKYGWRTAPDAEPTEVTCYGPVSSHNAMWRTFRVAKITRIHRPTTKKDTVRP